MNLNQVTINCSKTVEFFQQLGLLLIVDSLPRYARLECPDGSISKAVYATKKPPKRTPNGLRRLGNFI